MEIVALMVTHYELLSKLTFNDNILIMSSPEQDLPHSPDFLVVIKRPFTAPPSRPRNREAAYRRLLEETQNGIQEINKWLEEKGILDQVRFGGANVFGVVPTFCSKETAEILKDAPNIEAVGPGDAPMGF